MRTQNLVSPSAVAHFTRIELTISLFLCVCVSEGRGVNGSANKVNGDVNGLVRGESSERCTTSLDELQMRSVQPPDVVSSQRRLATVDDDSLEVGPAGVDNRGYTADTAGEALEPTESCQYDGQVTPTFANCDPARRGPTRLQYVPPWTQNPVRGFAADGRRSATPSSSKLPRNSPVQRPTSAPGGGGGRSAALRSTPLNGLENVYEEEPGTEVPTMMVRGRVLTPTVGLTVEEVDRITDSRRCTPATAAAAASRSSTSSTGRGSSPDLVNRTDFTRDDLELVARPHSTMSDDDDDDDETQDETFTCSEFDGGGRRRTAPAPMLDFANPYRLRVAPSLALPPPLPQSLPARHGVTPRDGGPSTTSSGSTADEMFSIDDRRRAAPPSTDGVVDLSHAATQLGWTPNFNVLAEVFLDIAALSDAGRSTAVASGRSPLASPVRSTPQPRPTSRSDTPLSHTRSPMNDVDAERAAARPLQRFASPSERMGVTDGHRSVTPASHSARHTPLDGVHRRTPSSPTYSSPYIPPSLSYGGRGTSSPREHIVSSAPPDAIPRQRGGAPYYVSDARTAPSRGTPRPVLEEYV